MTTNEVLVAARQLIASPKAWCQDKDAEDVDGEEVSACSADAVCWCATMAVEKVAGVYHSGAIAALETAIGNAFGDETYESVEEFNDSSLREHRDVISIFDAAIAATNV